MNMWNDARLLHAVANALFVLAAVIAAWVAGAALVQSPAFPLRSIRVSGPLEHVHRSQIVEALQGRVSGTFFTVDLESVRWVFESIPWVRRAEVRRLWPDRLEVRLEEHQALARWGRREEGRLLNRHAELFSAWSEADLPLFAGPPGSEREVSRRYAEFRELLAPLVLEPRQLILSDRRSWYLRLDSGLALQLGRDLPKDPVTARLSRFVQAYPATLGTLNRGPHYADLRYPDGFALRVPAMRAERSARVRPPA
jgi:cell division protein FtsQ